MLQTDDDTPAMPPRKATLTLQTTVNVSPGQTILISGAQRADAETKQLQTYVMVGATTSD